MKFTLAFAALVLLAGCSAGPTSRDTPAAYDFGPQREQAGGAKTIRGSVLLPGVTAPAWLDTTGVVYRLAYQDVARPQVYAGSRWATAPAALLTQRLRSRLAAASEGGVIGAGSGARADYTLQIELEEFSQVFDAAASSRGVVVARASLVSNAKRVLVAQRSFAIERAAASADAEGGVRALTAAGGELIDAIVAWTATAAQASK